MKTIIFIVVLAALVPASCPPVFGHDLWLERTADGLALLYGHRHSAHEGEDLLEYSPAVVLRAECYAADGSVSSPPLTGTYPVTVSSACAATFIMTSTGYWTKSAYGTKNVPKTEATYPIESWRSYESVKRIDAWSEAFAKPIVPELDIVPLGNPFEVSAGGKLRLLVTFERKPVEGVIVSYMGKPRGTTGADGIINIRLRDPGLQIVQASFRVPLAAPEADETVYTANLNFERTEDDK
jgi:nickel transport protein